MLVLSLLLMVAASISTASMLFGVVMVGYMIFALYACLLFHLKVEADRARAAFPVPPDQVNASTIQQDQRFLARSMRRLTVVVWTVSIAMAIFVFLLFPRGAGQGILGQLQFKPQTAMTGFADRVGFDQINRIRQNDEVVAHVTVWRTDQRGVKRVEGTAPLLLRGLALDRYARDSMRTQKPQWSRSRQAMRDREITEEAELRTYLNADAVFWKQKVVLEPTSTRFLFALPGVLSVKTDKRVSIRYSPVDESLQTVDVLTAPLEYEVQSTNQPTGSDALNALARQVLMPPPASDAKVLEQVRAYALREEVTGGLAAQRSRLARPLDESNEEIARRIEQHLRSQFLYTLDLTDSIHLFAAVDPVVAFLTTVKKGHCEYFASAMALMCQSLGIPARVVIGFRCDDYNVVGHYYVVRQSQAHSWVEVATPRGWVAFDPTSGRNADAMHASSLWDSIKHFVDFLEYKWAENVVAYDNKDRGNTIGAVDNAITQGAIDAGNWASRLWNWVNALGESSGFWSASFGALTLLVGLMIAAMVGMVVWYIIHRLRLRRRAHRIGFDALPRGQQLRLARQLAFYDLLTRILHRHRIIRQPHLTPLEFADSLVFLPANAYKTVHRLTQLFYRVRFGSEQLGPAQQRRLEQIVWRLGDTLDDLRPKPHHS
jgi:transglutaminase-like putative cysteine protease